MPYEILCRAEPAWLVPGTDEPYPGDYAGIVIALRPADSGVPFGEADGLIRRTCRRTLTAEEAAACRNRRVKVGAAGKLAPVTFADRWGALAGELLPLKQKLEKFASPETLDGKDLRETAAADEIAHARLRALPPVEAHTGTGLYAAKASPSHNDDTQSGAPSGQVITLTTGGLGGASAWAGGYVTNATRSQTRAIVSHADGTVTLEGDVTTWQDGDDLDVYDAWSTIQGALDQLWTDRGSAAFTTVQEIRVHAGTWNENILPNASMSPTPEYYLWMRAASGESVTINLSASVDWRLIEYSVWTDLKVTSSAPQDSNKLWIRHARAEGCEFDSISTHGFDIEFNDCIFPDVGVRSCYSGICGRMTFRRCAFRDGARVVLRQARGGHVHLESCTALNPSGALVTYDTAVSADGAWRLTILNCAVYGTPLVRYDRRPVDWLRVRNTICQGGTYVYDFDKPPRVQVESDHNCFYGQSTVIANWGGSDKTFLEWKALGYDEHSLNQDPMMADPANGDFSLQSGSPCRRTGAGAAAELDRDGQALDDHNPDMGACSTGHGLPEEPIVESVTASGKDLAVTVSGDEGAEHFARLLSDGGAVDDEGSRSGSGEIGLASSADGVFRTAVCWSEEGERARSAVEARRVMEEATNVLQADGLETSNYDIRRLSALEVDSGLDGSTGLRFDRVTMRFSAHRK